MISLIVITYNSRPLLPAFLAALATTDDHDYETIVVDNASSDGTVELLRAEHMNVRLIANEHNVGFGAACNRGMLAAHGDFFIFMNPDVLVTPPWLTVLRRNMAEHPDAAISCPSTLYPHETRSSATGVANTAAVPGCALMLRRTAWEQIGGFDEAMFLYWEDTELCWRAWLLGWRVLEDLEAVVYHERGGSTGGGRWEAEVAKNALYAHLKLRRWRAVVGFALRLLAKTGLRLGRGQTALLGAWWWNLRHLPATLRSRRTILRQRRANRTQIERLIALHTERGRRERRERQTIQRS